MRIVEQWLSIWRPFLAILSDSSSIDASHLSSLLSLYSTTGKTTLADNLIEHNGLLSERLAGTLRYLDSDPEEQRRGITMRSSAIGLQHTYVKQQGKTDGQNFIVHLVDSPGHTDFSYEVSSALTACDACSLVVDAVEGMGPRTHQVFREAFLNQHVPILVINKMDRLCTELCLTPVEAYLRIRSLLETINAAASAMITSAHQYVSKDDNDDNLDKEADDKLRQEEEDLWTFDAAKGNVVFGSALFGWGFTALSLAKSLFRSKTVSVKPLVLRNYIFGDYKLKGEKFLMWKSSAHNAEEELPLFCEYGLKPIWQIYEGVASSAARSGVGSSLFADGRFAHHLQGGGSNGGKSRSDQKFDTTMLVDVLEPLGVGATGTRSPRTLAEMQQLLAHTGANTEESILRCLIRRYRPLATALLDTVCEYAPSPASAAGTVRSRVLHLQPGATPAIHQAVKECQTSSEAPVIAHVCKFFATERSHVRDPSLPNPNEEKNILLGLARVLSGRLRTEESYYLLGPKHSKDVKAVQRKVRLYLLMGSTFVRVDEVPAGHLCAVSNLDDTNFKSVTLCSTIDAAPLQVPDRGVQPLVKVNVEAVKASDTEVLERGLLKLSLADASVEVVATAKGERLLACLGELHLEQVIMDLTKVYCSREIALRISDPIVDFAETTDWFENEDDYQSFYDDPSPPLRQAIIPPFSEEEGLSFARRGRMRSIFAGRGAALSLRVVPLVKEVHSSLQQGQIEKGCQEEVLKLCHALGLQRETPEEAFAVLKEHLCSIMANGNGLLESPGLRNGNSVKGILSETGQVFVPSTAKRKQITKQDAEENDDEDALEDEPSAEETAANSGQAEYNALGTIIRRGFSQASEKLDSSDIDRAAFDAWKTVKGSAVAGFQMATRAGPCCEEPVRNVLVVLEGVEIAMKKEGNEEYKAAKPLSSGMVVSALRSGVRCALLTRPVRLMEGYLKLTLNASLSVLGGLYSILSRRRGKVLDESMVEGTDLLLIIALIPQAEAFGLAPELFGRTSGEVTAPEMVFSHWDKLDVDPFWIPTTEEEKEDYGELQTAGDSSTGMDNTAIQYIRQVRARKGLPSDAVRTVIAAEKQRTLKR